MQDYLQEVLQGISLSRFLTEVDRRLSAASRGEHESDGRARACLLLSCWPHTLCVEMLGAQQVG